MPNVLSIFVMCEESVLVVSHIILDNTLTPQPHPQYFACIHSSVGQHL